MNLGAWIRAMQAVGLQASLDDLRDIAWLAARIGDPTTAAAADRVAPPAPPPTPPPSVPPADAEAAARDARPLSLAGRVRPSDDEAPALYGAARGDGSQRARRIQLRGAPALPQSLAIARALRPLSRRRPGRTLVLDERATAELIADTGVRAPVWRPARERWFDIVLAVEEMPSMAAWQPMVAAFERLLQRQGGFRSVTRLVLRVAGGQVQAHTPAGRPTPPRGLRERDGRRIVLVLSDCTSEGWHRGAIGSWLQQVAAELPLAVVQLLPPALWPNTAVGFAELRAWAPRMAAPAARLHVRRPGWAEGEPGLVLPVLALEPAAVAAWARMVAAAGDAWTTAALLPLADVDDAGAVPPAPAEAVDVLARVAAFRASASRDAQRLAAYFSVVRPLTPPVMRVIHQALAPASGAGALAQVFLGGLLKCEHDGATPDEAVYDFHPGLREHLQGGLTRQEFVQVNLALHDFLQQESGTAFDFFALLEDRHGSERLPDAALPFVQMARSAARRFAGDATAAPAPAAAAETRASVVAEIAITAAANTVSFAHRSGRGALTVRHDWPTDVEALLERALADTDTDSPAMAALVRASLPQGLQDSPAYADGPPWAELVLDARTAAVPWELLFRSELPNRPPLAVWKGLTRRTPPRPRAAARSGRALVIGDPQLSDTRWSPLPGARREAELATAALSRLLSTGGVQSLIHTRLVPISAALRDLSALRVLHIAAHGDLLPRASAAADAAGQARRARLVLGQEEGLALDDLLAAGPMPELVYLGAEHMAVWAPALLGRGAQVVVAPAGLVDDDAAALFAEVFYSVLEAGQSLLEATHQARAACYQRMPDCDAWGRFQVWGDPAWRLVDDDAAVMPAAGAAAQPPAAPTVAAAKVAEEADADADAGADAGDDASADADAAEPAYRGRVSLPELDDCEYLAYVSYAQADDQVWFNWITDFGRELERGMAARLRGVRLPRLQLSGQQGPVAGRMTDQLGQRLASSFALIVVVHDNFVHSEWCLHEVEAFVQRYGREAAMQRLYVLAMSQSAVQALERSERWQRLFGKDAALWLPFFDPAEKDRPLPIYLAPSLVSPQFREPFERLRSDLAAKVLASAEGRHRAPPPVPPAGQTTAIGFVPAASEEGVRRLMQVLEERGVDTRQLRRLSPDELFGDFASLAGAERLVLPFDDEPLSAASLVPGGHLQLQRDAWLRRGRPAELLFWLDLRAEPPPRERWRGAAAWVAQQQGLVVLTAATLADRLLGHATPAEAPAPVQGARLYIESNRFERRVWEPLGEHIRRGWDDVCRAVAPARVPPLVLRVRGLPVDQIDSFPSLDDADGVVLLWGQKTSEALLTHINKVELKLGKAGGQAPGMVAYLMPPQGSSEPLPAWGWPVLRFDASDHDDIRVVPDEQPQLDRFLRRVLDHRLRRDGETA